MVHDLSTSPEAVEQRRPQDRAQLFLGVLAVQSIGADQLDVPLVCPRSQAFLDDDRDAHLAVRIGLEATLDLVGEHDGDFRACLDLGTQRSKAEGVFDRRPRGAGDVGEHRRVGHRLARDEHIGVIGEVGLHQPLSVFERQSHGGSPIDWLCVPWRRALSQRCARWSGRSVSSSRPLDRLHRNGRPPPPVPSVRGNVRRAPRPRPSRVR